MSKKEDEEREPGEDEIWPRGAPKADPHKLFEFVAELADEKTKREVEKIEAETKRLEKIASSNGDYGLSDMPETVLSGRLGEICNTHMLLGGRFPVAYAWPALIAVASSLVPRYGPKQRVNVYTALVGPVHSGKTQAIDAAQQLLGIESPVLMNVMAGSAESLMRHIADAAGNARLFSPDELGHLLEKASILNASFASILSRAFYHEKFTVLMQQKARAEFNASLSILGGIVDTRFEDLFSRATTAGLYDRFMFGACPDGFKFDYYPFETQLSAFDLQAVGVHPDVWVEKSVWLSEDKELEPRVVEIALRCAIVCAAFDGKSLLTAADLGAARKMAVYQQRIRRLLKPNEGEGPEARIALKMIEYLRRLGGRYVTKRKLLHDTSAYRTGPSIADRALSVLHANGEIEIKTKPRPILVRLILDEEAERSEE